MQRYNFFADIGKNRAFFRHPCASKGNFINFATLFVPLNMPTLPHGVERQAESLCYGKLLHFNLSRFIFFAFSILEDFFVSLQAK